MMFKGIFGQNNKVGKDEKIEIRLSKKVFNHPITSQYFICCSHCNGFCLTDSRRQPNKPIPLKTITVKNASPLLSLLNTTV